MYGSLYFLVWYSLCGFVRDGELDICQYVSSYATFTTKLVGGHKPRLSRDRTTHVAMELVSGDGNRKRGKATKSWRKTFKTI